MAKGDTDTEVAEGWVKLTVDVDNTFNKEPSYGMLTNYI
jgi:hypothetical protein